MTTNVSYASSRRGEDEYAQADRDTIKLLSQRARGASQKPDSDEILLDEESASVEEPEDAPRR